MKIKSRDTNGNEKIVEIDSIRRMNINPGEKILIQVDVGNLPPTRAKQFMDDVRQYFENQFPQNTIIVTPTSLIITVMP